MELDTDLNEALTFFNLKKCARTKIKKIKHKILKIKHKSTPPEFPNKFYNVKTNTGGSLSFLKKKD
jgi:hypothetical protein